MNWVHNNRLAEIVYTVDIDESPSGDYIISVEHAGKVMHTETTFSHADANQIKVELENEYNTGWVK